MEETLCGVCTTAPKKYKCPTCALPYCSLQCFKSHKATHLDTASTPKPTTSTAPVLPAPPPPAPIPRYLKKKTDFSVLASNPKFKDMISAYPTLLPTLQRVYAATIQPDPEEERRRAFSRDNFRGRGSRGRGRGRGGFGGRNGGADSGWTQKKGDADGLRMLKRLREGEMGEREEEGMRAFVQLVDEVFGRKEEG